MLIEREFVVEEHAEAGFIGLRPSDMPDFDPGYGRTVAHDFLEHAPGDDGSIAGELQALGAIQYVRGDSGAFNVDPAELLSNDLRELFEFFTFRDYQIEKAPLATEVHHLFEGTWKHMRKTLKSELNIGTQHANHTWDDTSERAQLAPFLRHRWDIVRWASIGYDRAAERYGRLGSWRVFHAFQEIEKRAQAFIDANEEYVGEAKLTIRFDTETGELTFKEFTGFEDDYNGEEE